MSQSFIQDKASKTKKPRENAKVTDIVVPFLAVGRGDAQSSALYTAKLIWLLTAIEVSQKLVSDSWRQQAIMKDEVLFHTDSPPDSWTVK